MDLMNSSSLVFTVLTLLTLSTALSATRSDTNDTLMNELQSCGIDINRDNIDVQKFLPTMPIPTCLDQNPPSLGTHGFQIIDDVFPNQTYAPRIHRAMQDLQYMPSKSHVAEHLSPRCGGDGHRIPSYRSDYTTWGREAGKIENNDSLQRLDVRHQLWTHFTMPLRNIDERIVADTDVLYTSFPTSTRHRAHSCGSSGLRQHLLYKLIYFVHDSVSMEKSVRIHQHGKDCSHGVVMQRNRLLVVDCQKVEMEILPLREQRYMVVQWLRGNTGFGVP